MDAGALDAAVRTTCPYCGVGCGVVARPGAGGVTITGDGEHPANFGRLCSKGTALGETLGHETRLLHPLCRQGGALRRASWDTALDTVAGGLAATIAAHGPDAVAFYLSGQLLTEDYYVANKLLKGFIGSANVDTNSRLCMASSVAGHKRAFGADIVPGCYADIDHADLIVLVGSNAAWCHPVLHRRMLRARETRGARIVVIDPRPTATSAEADMVLPVAPGMDAALFAGLLVHLADSGHVARGFVAQHCEGLPEALATARRIAPDTASCAAACGLPADAVAAFFTLFAGTDRTVTAWSQGVNQSAQGTDKVGAIINCHLATGRIGRPGATPLSLTGQPNAMGGREVGGMANMLAAHMDFDPAARARVARFWNAPRLVAGPGLKAVDMFAAIGRGEIRALWVMGTNPAVSLPRNGAARAALGQLDLLVVSENVAATETIASGAHVVLPAAAWGEKDGTVTNSERRISRQRAFLPPAGEARPDWWMIAQVARRMGYGAHFGYRSAADIFREHAALSAYENDGARPFDLGALAQLSDAAYDALAPVQWPLPARGSSSSERLFAAGGFATPSGRARFVAPALPAPALPLTPDEPYRLNTGRVRDHWHTMSRTGLAPALASHESEPFVIVAAADAARDGLTEGGLAALENDGGACVLRVRIAPDAPPGQAFVPIHWNAVTAGNASVGQLVPDATDPFSGQPELKAGRARLRPVRHARQGVLLLRRTMAMPRLPDTVWSRAAIPGGWLVRFDSDLPLAAWTGIANGMIGAARAEAIEYRDTEAGLLRIAGVADDRIVLTLTVAPLRAVPQPDAAALTATFNAAVPRSRFMALTAGRVQQADAGPIVCACHGVRYAAIAAAIAGGCASVAAVGEAVAAGTNCGSCQPEIRQMLRTREMPAGA